MISVCIPAYKNTEYLGRLLRSLQAQDFRDFEVVITDDSPDDRIEQFLAGFQDLPGLIYHRNPQSLGTPENWNEAVRRAKGRWIKIMHDDDWLADAGALSALAAEARKGQADFIFSAYTNVYLGEGREELVEISGSRMRALDKSRATLLAKNVIGPPSVVMYRKDPLFEYDKTMKWVVDIDFYIRYLTVHPFSYLPLPLVKVGISAEQVTQACFRVPEVEVPENFALLEKMGTGSLRPILAYDGCWRFLRNLQLREPEDIRKAGYAGEVPAVIKSMLRWQRRWPSRWLKLGMFSKSLMFLHYLFHVKSL